MDHISDQDTFPRSMKIETGRISDNGKHRLSNEDSLVNLEFFIEEGLGITFCSLHAVADGVGGSEGGDVASSLALRQLARRLIQSLLIPILPKGAPIPDHTYITQLLKQAVQSANNEIYLENEATSKHMGTTLAAVLIVEKTAFIASVGDSRVYLLDDEVLNQLTTDHSLVAEMVARGEITQEEAYAHPKRNVITRCLGMQQEIEVQMLTQELKFGNSLIICSDGLWEMVRDTEIKAVILGTPDLQAASQQLVDLANKNGGKDNITVILVKVGG